MLEELATIGDECIVSWQPSGKAFRVHLPDVFAKTVMPRYFSKQTKYKSFLRQLHAYGFHRISTGMDRGAYYHRMFTRNNKSMSLRMTCPKIKKHSDARHPRHAAVDPDLYFLKTNVDKDQNQNRYGLVTNGLVFDQEVADCHSPLHPQLLGSEIGLDQSRILLEQAKRTILSRDEEEQVSPHHGYDSSISEMSHEAWAALDHVNYHQKQGDEGIFAGKRFFSVADETTTLPMMEDFDAIIID